VLYKMGLSVSADRTDLSASVSTKTPGFSKTSNP
jgi:hypothetical protein